MDKKQITNSRLKAVDFFCGGGGMSYGMQQAGIKVLAGIDNDLRCEKTYLANISGAEFISADVFQLKEKDLQKQLNLEKNDDNLILIGCSPCQFWSIINTNKEKSEKSKNLLIEFQRFVSYFKPGFVVVENVPGVLRKKEESGLQAFIDWLEKKKYKIHFKVHNVYDYGVPQNRNRFTLIANRISNEEIEPVKSSRKKHVIDVIGEHNGFEKIESGHIDQTDFMHTVSSMSDLNKKRISKVKKDGGSRLDFAKDSELQLQCFIGKDESFQDTFGRLWWNKPAPTITTKFYSISNGRFVHPEENRALSLREGAVLQSFPKKYKFFGTHSSVARQIGNAVPPEYAKSIGKALIKSYSNAV